MSMGKARRYVILIGGLHIEMAMLKLIGDWFDGSRLDVGGLCDDCSRYYN